MLASGSLLRGSCNGDLSVKRDESKTWLTVPASLPPQSAQSIVTQAVPYNQIGLPQSSQTVPFSVATVTTSWGPPTFPTATSPSTCTDNVCPALDGQTCSDSSGHVYGILCGQRFTGITITSIGKDRLLLDRGADDNIEARSYTGSLDACAASCDQFDKEFCTGVGYQYGVCALYDSIMGTLPQSGAIAFVRQT